MLIVNLAVLMRKLNNDFDSSVGCGYSIISMYSRILILPWAVS